MGAYMMATKSKARGAEADEAVTAWRKWGPIGGRHCAAYAKGSDAAEEEEWIAGEAILKAKATTVAGVVAKLQITLLHRDGFDHEAYIDAIRDTIRGVYDQLPPDMRERVAETVKATAAPTDRERLAQRIAAMPD